MGRSFIYASEAVFAAGAARFATGIDISPGSLGLSIPDATEYAALNTTFQTAYATATEPSTRTRGTVAAKDVAKLALRQRTGLLAGRIVRVPTVTDQQLIDLGLEPRKTPTPVPPITVKPALDILSINGYEVLINVRQLDMSKRGKLPGAYGIQVMSFVGETPSNDLGQWKIEGQSTVQKLKLTFPTSLPAFTKVWLTAGWISSRLQAGPACPPVAFNLGTFVVQNVEVGTNGTIKLAA